MPTIKKNIQQQNQQNTQEQQQHEEQLSTSQVVLFSRLNNHLLFHYVPLVQFWRTQRLCVTLDEFQIMLQKIGFYKGKQEIYEMRQNNIEFIGLDRVLMGVNQWKSQQISIVQFMKKQSQHLSNQKQQHNNNTTTKQPYSKRQRAASTLMQQHNNNKSINNNIYSDNNINSRISNRTAKSTSQYYLQQTHKKQHQALINLNNTLIKTKNQSHYQLAIKIGQLNDICKKLKNNLTYLIITKQNSSHIQIVQKSNKNDTTKIISQKMFDKRYEEFKLQSNNMIDQIQGTLQKDLRQTLVQVMYLSDQLEKQIALLKRKGVNNV